MVEIYGTESDNVLQELVLTVRMTYNNLSIGIIFRFRLKSGACSANKKEITKISPEE